jgi:G:T-mismatch repair DNA endonuclease (very short patch repair protein)
MAMKTAAKLAKASGALEDMLGEILMAEGINYLLSSGLPGKPDTKLKHTKMNITS